MKTAIKKILVRWNIYHFIRYSFLYDLYARVFKPDLRQQHKKEIDFYRSFLGDARLIFDIGAYDGHKTAAFLPLAKKIASADLTFQRCYRR